MHRPLVLLLQRVPHILNAVQAGRSLALPLSKISHSTLTHHSSAAATRAHQRTETRTHTRHGIRHASTTASSSTVAPPFVRSPRTVATAPAPSPPHTRSHTAQPRAQRPHNTSPGPTTSTAPVQRAPSSSRAAFLHTHASARASPAVIRNGVRPCVLGVCVCVRTHSFIPKNPVCAAGFWFRECLSSHVRAASVRVADAKWASSPNLGALCCGVASR